ncbi:PA3496 family putative envelope integrity protein [Psychromonas arctica]|uniref:PA3496 family putative envelope integrity protein n=1 Tax=Psychromonas arctica TaxID=168275 RepID=UPI002FCF7D8B
MANSNRNSLQTEDDTQDMVDFFSEDDWDEENSSVKKKQALMNDKKRGKVRRSIEEIKERKRLKELLGDDYDDLDYLDS